MLMNLQTAQWDDDILHQLHIPLKMMPEIRSSSEIFAHVASADASIDAGVNEMAGVPIAGMTVPLSSTLTITVRCTVRRSW